MTEQGFKPTPEDEQFLQQLGKRSELLKQSEMSYQEHLDFLRGAYAMSLASKGAGDTYAVDDMVDQIVDNYGKEKLFEIIRIDNKENRYRELKDMFDWLK